MPKNPRAEGLRLRKHADKSTGERVVRYDPETGARKLVNPATEGEGHEPWPLAGISLEVAPEVTTVSTTLLAEGRAEGWISVEGEQVVHRPGGPASDPWRVTHTFVQVDRVTFHTLDGDVTYRVTHKPDKYADPGDDDTPVTDDVYAAGATRVDWFHRLVKEA